jgi:DNA/RNA endonuclease G (NUC1)
MQCHFRAEDPEACMQDGRNVSDPFHVDPLLSANSVARLGTGAFSGTGHDRGHLAPYNSFSWHACGAYKTFTMANMAPQWATHNRQIWAQLETQILFWGVTDGPVHVVTGPIWNRFPAARFEAIKQGLADVSTIPAPGELLARLDDTALPVAIPRPTGFYKVVYRPGDGAEPDRAIAFLVPHTKETGLPFWYFISTVTLLEEVSNLRFGFPDHLKGWPDLSYWRAPSRQVPSNWSSPREGCSEKLPVAGWMDHRPLPERVSICRSPDAAE